jgi:hypothetical protein
LKVVVSDADFSSNFNECLLACVIHLKGSCVEVFTGGWISQDLIVAVLTDTHID